MPPKANANATDARETIEDSIEAKGDAQRAAAENVDVEMKDRDEPDADGEADAEGEVDADGEDEEEPERDLLQTIHDLATFLCAYKEE